MALLDPHTGAELSAKLFYLPGYGTIAPLADRRSILVDLEGVGVQLISKDGDESGEPIRRKEAPPGYRRSTSKFPLAVSQDGKRMALSSISGAEVLTISDGTLAGRVLAPKHEIGSLAFHPRNQWLAIGIDGGRILIADWTQSGQPLITLGTDLYQDHITALAWDATGTYLAAGGVSKKVIVFDVKHRTAVISLTHPAPVRGVSFAHGGRLIRTIDSNAIVRDFLWQRDDLLQAGRLSLEISK